MVLTENEKIFINIARARGYDDDMVVGCCAACNGDDLILKELNDWLEKNKDATKSDICEELDKLTPEQDIDFDEE